MTPQRARARRIVRHYGRWALTALRVPTLLTAIGLLGLGSLTAGNWLGAAVITAIHRGCPVMSLSTAACSAGGAAVMGTLIVVTIGARASWLGVAAAREVRELGVVPMPVALSDAARHGESAPVSCVAGAERVAFCAGLWHPRIYISAGMVTALPRDELQAVLAHENAHARRRDPLRGLLWRAFADVVFFAPLLRWGHQHRHVRAELAADRAAVAHTGAPALAGALLRLAEPCAAPPPAAAPGFGPTDPAIDARIAALTSTPPPRRPRPIRAAAASVAGVLGTGLTAICLPTLVQFAIG